MTQPFSRRFASVSTVYRKARQVEKAVATAFWRIDLRECRLKTAETGVAPIRMTHRTG
jgi:hypothetical protein